MANGPTQCSEENYDYMCNKLLATLPELRISPMDGTYLAWIDFSAYLKPEEMHDFFENNAVLHQALVNGLVVKATQPLCA